MSTKTTVENDECVSPLRTPSSESSIVAKPGIAVEAVDFHQLPSVVVGELVALGDGGRTPMVIFRGQPGCAAVRARSVIDVYGAHIGRRVVLMFEAGDPALPIVMGVIQEDTTALRTNTAAVDVEGDGERLIVSAKEQLVIRCGKASITLTKAGKVLVDGTYISSRSSGTNRLKGGSVQIN